MNYRVVPSSFSLSSLRPSPILPHSLIPSNAHLTPIPGGKTAHVPISVTPSSPNLHPKRTPRCPYPQTGLPSREEIIQKRENLPILVSSRLLFVRCLISLSKRTSSLPQSHQTPINHDSSSQEPHDDDDKRDCRCWRSERRRRGGILMAKHDRSTGGVMLLASWLAGRALS